MSEYQYYEFLAVDRPLSSREMSELRGLSTRARINSTSFTNEYHWGDFKGDPLKLMKHYFDLHLYLGFWSTGIFMVRLPNDAVPEELDELLGIDGLLEFDWTDSHCLISWILQESEFNENFGEDDAPDWLPRLAPIREELLRGDFRGLYIAWLAAVNLEIIEDDETEPISAAGLGRLTPAQQALAEFMEVDADLLAGAALGSPDLEDEKPSPAEVEAWLDGLPPQEVRSLMQLLWEGRGREAERNLKNGYYAWKREQLPDRAPFPPRPVRRLREQMNEARERRLEAEKLKRERIRIKKRKKREAYLSTLMQNPSKEWAEVEELVQRGHASTLYNDFMVSEDDFV